MTWPATPPREPGFYWLLAPSYGGIPQIAQVMEPEGQPLVFVEIGDDFCFDLDAPDMEGAHWHPQRIEQP